MANFSEQVICKSFSQLTSYPIPGSDILHPQTRRITTQITKTISSSSGLLPNFPSFSATRLSYHYQPEQLSTAIATAIGQITLTSYHSPQSKRITQQAYSLATSGPPSDFTLLEEAALLYFVHQEQDFDSTRSIVEQVAHSIQQECLHRKENYKHGAPYQHAPPQGITHFLLLQFARIIYPGTWNAGGVLLVKTLLMDYHFTFLSKKKHYIKFLLF